MRTLKKLLTPLPLLLLLPAHANAAELEHTKTLLDLYRDGGPIMHLIALCSVAALALAVYCFVSLRKSRMLPPLLVSELNTFLSQKQLNEAYTHCQANPGPLTQSLSNALIKANYERDMYNKPAMENALADECFRTETRLMVTVNYFNTLAVLAPMIGLLGTVSGMINSFGALTAGRAEAADLAKGIGEALVATGGGLLLAIPSMFLYFHFRGAVSTQMADMHAALSHMLDRFTGEAHGTPPSVQSHNAAAFTQ
ncbi:MAG: MotA/TolQ/ExbB proton channel family protein [Verrucomicrobiota bacterium]